MRRNKQPIIFLLTVLLALSLSGLSCASGTVDPGIKAPDEPDNGEYTGAAGDENGTLDGPVEEEYKGESGCDEMETVRLTAAPAEPGDLSYIFPMGLMTNAHVTPVDHQYYFWQETDVPPDRYPVYSPADGYIKSIAYLENDYIVHIEHSCDVYSIYIHLEQLAGPIQEYNGQVTWGNGVNLRVPVKAGELFAYDGGTAGFDFSLHDERVLLPGYINPESYIAESWKVHTVDPYDYFDEPVRSRLLEKNLRQAEPPGGKIDHDIFSRLSGNWFVENTNGYAGAVNTDEPIKADQQVGYWNTHLAVAPDPIDPSVTIVSFGWFEGRCEQYAVKEPFIHPSDVSVDTGMVKYELYEWLYVHRGTGEPWGHMNLSFADDLKLELGNQLGGTVLFQLMDETRLKMEIFPRITADEVSGFTENAVIYER